MKFVIALALVALVAARPNDDYSRYDNFDIDEVINNLRLLKSYTQCFRGTGKCTPEGTDFKKWIPNAVQSSCGDCSEKQKTLIARVIKAIMEKLSDDWVELNKEHNPESKYDAELKEFLAKYGN